MPQCVAIWVAPASVACRTGVLVIIYSIRIKQILCKYDNATKKISFLNFPVCIQSVSSVYLVCVE